MECQFAFEFLIQKLTIAPVLAYPNFMFEKDTSVNSLGAVLSQKQEGNQLHAVHSFHQLSVVCNKNNY